MKTNKNITKQAFQEMHEVYYEWRNHEGKIQELHLIFENNDCNYFNNFMQSKRVKAHSGAFYAVIIALRPFMPKGYYASNPQIKAMIKEFWGMDYREFLAPLVAILEEQRNEHLEG